MRAVWLRRGMVALTVLGVALAAYLTYVHYSGTAPACTAGQACIKVQTSLWSKLDGVPVALIGLIGYVFILGSLLAPDREETRLATLALTLIGFGFSAYLTYREIHSIHAICEECAASAVFLTLLFVGAVIRYIEGVPKPAPPPPMPAQSKAKKATGDAAREKAAPATVRADG